MFDKLNWLFLKIGNLICQTGGCYSVVIYRVFGHLVTRKISRESKNSHKRKKLVAREKSLVTNTNKLVT